ncbi:MAG TPA: divergent polysaccharide deacetylase family protein [Candidatus Cloacimonas sp.]|nr:divergent polysaccharide deacetylase family protein [Candidatus Cloacimonas sp.]HPA24046.1 divergent polysaccharide deacetylase family protein [Candidatus Cloacimonas sp.]HPX09691.1 divergent polysaccharide deacetylase family protein [Candidatus Cloacimonas sp.]HQC31545.1 divergent polysaccharide deacetylase family protein [Candidatus Cloacimonas sp.]
MEKTFLILCVLFSLLLFSCTKKTEREIPEKKIEPEQIEKTGEKTEDKSVSTPDMTAIESYKYTWSKTDAMPPVVIIIDDFGQNAGQLLDDFSALPEEIAFSILPDLPYTQTAARLAGRTNHETLIHIPMQALDHKANPGKRYLQTGMDKYAISDLLQDFYAQIPNAIAANNHMGSEVTADLSTMISILEELDNLGLYFLDSATTNKSAAFTAAKNLGLKIGKRDIFLDVPDNSDATIINKIEGLAKYKGRNEPVVIITHCHNREKLNALQKFLTQIDNMGIELISVSKLFRKLGYPA